MRACMQGEPFKHGTCYCPDREPGSVTYLESRWPRSTLLASFTSRSLQRKEQVSLASAPENLWPQLEGP
jgi:hypothetical protein